MAAPRVALFVTCLTDIFFPDVAASVVRLLRRHGVNPEFPPGQTCCGQPAFNSGFRDEARTMADNFIATFEPYDYIVTPSGSCAGMAKVNYPGLYADPVRRRHVEDVAGRIYEFSQFMVDVLGVTDVGARVQGRATYHNNCHMTRELGVGDAPRQMLRAVAGLDFVEMERNDLCCGFGGSFAVKMESISVAMGDEKIDHAKATGADYLVSCDMGCLMHLGGRMQRQGLQMRPVHLAQLLWEGVADK